jgi:hypothetical protein
MHTGSVGKLSGFYVFWWQYLDASGTTRDCAVCFKSPGIVQQSAWTELIEDVSKGPELPDAVVFLYLLQDAESFNAGKNHPNVSNSMIRFESRIPCFQTGIDLKGGAVINAVLGNPRVEIDVNDWSARITSSLDQLLLAGLHSIFSADSVIIEAPAGFEFVKHSEDRQSRSRVFLRAEQALTDTAVVSFVALCVWLKLLGHRSGAMWQIKAIYVDTMGISPVAFALREFFGLVGESALPQVESYHSYGGLGKVRISDKANTFCLISASTSMNMHRSWLKEKKVNAWQVATLVTQQGAMDSSHALVALSDQRLSAGNSNSSEHAPYSIRIKGETFVPDLEGAKSVLIGLKHSLLDKSCDFKSDARAVFSMYQSHALLVYGSATDSNPTYKPIFIDHEALTASDFIASNTMEVIDQYGYAKAKWIIHQDDKGSKDMAALVAKHISLPTERVIVVTEVPNAENFNRDPIIVLGGVVGQGSQMIGVSRDLRGKHKGNRLYLACIHIPADYSGKQMLAKNLEKTKPKEGIYKFKAICGLPTGTGGASAFAAEQRLYELYPDIGWPKILQARFELMSKKRVAGTALGFLPTGLNLDKQLLLREGFTFWTEKYDEGNWVAAVLWTISATLQRAREDQSLVPSLQLRSTALGQVYLDPENFTRYNDGIVQAALLRAALDHELDYRGQKDASNRMQRFLTRMFRNIADLNSEAALEFLVSLATSRLKLENNDLDIFIKQVTGLIAAQNASPMREAVNCYLQILRTKFNIGPEAQKATGQPF